MIVTISLMFCLSNGKPGPEWINIYGISSFDMISSERRTHVFDSISQMALISDNRTFRNSCLSLVSAISATGKCSLIDRDTL